MRADTLPFFSYAKNQMSKSNILFYSPDCQYSMQVLGLLDQYGIRDEFMIVNINNPQYKLPSFVDRVPMIFIKGKNEIVIDEHIPQYMSTLKQAPQQVEAIMSLSDIGSGFSDNFSFIENGQQQPKNFVSVAGGAANANASAAASANAAAASGGKSSKFDSSEYERFTQQRDLDAASFMNKPR